MRIDIYHHEDPALLARIDTFNATLQSLINVLQPDLSTEDATVTAGAQAIANAMSQIPHPEQPTKGDK